MAYSPRDPGSMTDSELLDEIRRLDCLDDQAATRNPMSLLHRIMGGYRIRPHLEIIAEQMTRVERGEIDRLLITVPPQTGKSVTTVVGGAMWWLTRHPTDRIIVGSYGDSLAVDRGREIQGLVTEHGGRFGLRLARGASSVQDWRVTSGGGVRSVGVGAGITGHPGDIVFIDDPHKNREEADSLRFRDRVERWFSADIVSRLSPGAPIIMIMTRWHEDDLAARVTKKEGTTDKGGRWQIVRMPALCDDPLVDPLHRSFGAPLPHPKIRIGDVDGALRHWEDKRRSSSVRDWFSLYMCDPRPAEGALLTRELLRQRRCYETDTCDHEPIRAAVAVDPSGGGRDTAGIIGGHLGSDKRLYITHDYSGVMPSDAWSRRACEMAVDIDADTIVFESNYGGDQALSLIRTAWDALRNTEREAERQRILANQPNMTARRLEQLVDRVSLRYSRLCPRITRRTARKNKRLRAEPVAQQWTENKISTANYLPEVEEEWATWQQDNTDSPGRIDATVYLAMELLPTPPAGSNTRSDPPVGSLPTTGMSPLGPSGGSSGFGPLG